MQVFPIPPAAARGAWILYAVIALMLALSLLMGWLIWSTKNSRAEVSSDGLRLVGDLWGRTIPIEQLRLDEARVVDVREEHGLQPRSRTMGTGLGGFAAGWFRLRNGEKALIYLTDWAKAVYVPTTDGYSLLLSQHEPDRFLAALRGE